jgi:hypothetical protein
VSFAKKELGGLKYKKIAYLFYDNPAGKQPLAVLEDLAKSEGPLGVDRGVEGQGLPAQQGRVAGLGSSEAEGYHTMQFAGVGTDFQGRRMVPGLP